MRQRGSMLDHIYRFVLRLQLSEYRIRQSLLARREFQMKSTGEIHMIDAVATGATAFLLNSYLDVSTFPPAPSIL